MTSLIVKAGLAALVALTSLSAAAPTAAAASSDLRVYVQYRDGYRHHDWHRHQRPVAACTPRNAEAKATRMGLRRARVVDVSRRTITVFGFDRRGPDRIVFAKVRGCPVIR